MDENSKKMTLEEYQQSHEHSSEIKSAKSFMYILAVAVGIAIVSYLFAIVLKLFEIHNIAGYVGLFCAVVIFVFLYLVPVIKIYRTKSFFTNVTRENAHQAKRHNRLMREELADKMIDSVSKVNDLDWYSDDHVRRLAIARHTRNDNELKEVLTEIYTSDINKTANQLITNCAVEVGILTAVSQSNTVDALLVVVFELKLIKDIIYLYGYRPSDSQMVRIMRNVLRNSLLTYGISVTTEGIGQIVGRTMKSIPIVGDMISSGIQGVTNGLFAAQIGIQTRKYLIKEYKLQDALDNVELATSEEEERKLYSKIASDVKKSTVKGKATDTLKTKVA